MRLLKPSRFEILGLGLSEQLFEAATPGVIQAVEFLLRNRFQNEPRIFGELPKFRIEFLPDLIRGMVPGPVQVERQLGEGIRASKLRCQHGISEISHKSVFTPYAPALAQE